MQSFFNNPIGLVLTILGIIVCVAFVLIMIFNKRLLENKIVKTALIVVGPITTMAGCLVSLFC